MRIFIIILAAALFLVGCKEIDSVDDQKESPREKVSKNPERGSVNKKKSTKPQKRQAGRKKPGNKDRKKVKKGSLLLLIKKLPLKSERASGYNRDDFTHWSDLDGNGCDTREDVLRRQNLRPQGTRCFDDRGLWYSAYDGLQTRDSSSFDVDHMVPLAEAYASGAWRWSDKRRELYANDPYGPSLIAVSASSNREKSDQDPAEWLPKRKGYLCTYIKNWVLVKYRWQLKVDRQEKRALLRLSQRCPTAKIKIKKR